MMTPIQFVKEHESCCPNATRIINAFKCWEDVWPDTVGGLCRMRKKDLLRARNLGRGSIAELESVLSMYGLGLESDYFPTSEETKRKLARMFDPVFKDFVNNIVRAVYEDDGTRTESEKALSVIAEQRKEMRKLRGEINNLEYALESAKRDICTISKVVTADIESGKWVSANSRMPKSGKPVLVTDGNHIAISHQEHRGWVTIKGWTPTFWAYVPKPPKNINEPKK